MHSNYNNLFNIELDLVWAIWLGIILSIIITKKIRDIAFLFSKCFFKILKKFKRLFM